MWRNEMQISPFPAGYRGSGILLHVTSLPAPFGVGDFGPTAYRWIDLLSSAGQTWWQVLPLGPTGYGNCPYQLVTTFGLNPLLISPELLARDAFIEPDALPEMLPIESKIDFAKVSKSKRELIHHVWKLHRLTPRAEIIDEYERFQQDQQFWLNDYAKFECLRHKFQTGNFANWPIGIASRDANALAREVDQFADEYEVIRFGQFLAFRQLAELRDYAHAKGVHLIGDLPFFVSPESSDVWANPDLFQLDELYRPVYVAGVPPDYFSETGQLWGNPVYNWDAMKRANYKWWIERIRALLHQVDVVRLDHFRGFAAAWHVPAAATTALEGFWKPGPEGEFFHLIRQEFGGLPFLAEDLGEITSDVWGLRDEFHLTGMRVLQFAFDGNPENIFLPENYVTNTVAYTATHDNDTTLGWYEALNNRDRQYVRQYLRRRKLKSTDVAAELIWKVWFSDAALAMTPLQDLLNLGSAHRMNIPGIAEGNWMWRCQREMIPEDRLKWLAELTEKSGRCPVEIPFTE